MDKKLVFGKVFVSIVFSVAILFASFTVLRPFMLAIIWAVIIAIAAWPMHRRIRASMPKQRFLSALLSTLTIGAAIVIPMIFLIVFVVQDVVGLTSFLITADKQGVPAPTWLKDFPFGGKVLLAKWNMYLAQPDQISGVMRDLVQQKLGVVQSTAQAILVNLSSRIATLVFALWILFFLFRDGDRFVTVLNRIGEHWLPKRWFAYAVSMPGALRAAVNGLIFVSFGEAVVLAVMFYLFDVPSAVLLGVACAILAFIPMAAPLLLAILGLILFSSGAQVAGVTVFVVGTLVVIVADYLIRPKLIQGGTRLPFLVVLFGIFGGVVSMGIVGLIIGPVLLVLLVVLLREAAQLDEPITPAIHHAQPIQKSDQS